MALYKPGGTAVVKAARIDGVVWSPKDDFGTLRTWSYPTSRPSARFERINKDVQLLAEKWASLDAAQQATWTEYSKAVVARDWCPWWEWWYWTGMPPTPAEETFKSTNLFRNLQGLGWIDEAPAWTYREDGDRVEAEYLNYLGHEFYPMKFYIGLRWGRVTPIFSVAFNACIWMRNENNFMQRPDQKRKLKYLGCFEIYNNIALVANDKVCFEKGTFPGAVLEFDLAICEKRCAPFTLCSCWIRNLSRGY